MNNILLPVAVAVSQNVQTTNSHRLVLDNIEGYLFDEENFNQTVRQIVQDVVLVKSRHIEGLFIVESIVKRTTEVAVSHPVTFRSLIENTQAACEKQFEDYAKSFGNVFVEFTTEAGCAPRRNGHGLRIVFGAPLINNNQINRRLYVRPEIDNILGGMPNCYLAQASGYGEMVYSAQCGIVGEVFETLDGGIDYFVLFIAQELKDFNFNTFAKLFPIVFNALDSWIEERAFCKIEKNKRFEAVEEDYVRGYLELTFLEKKNLIQEASRIEELINIRTRRLRTYKNDLERIEMMQAYIMTEADAREANIKKSFEILEQSTFVKIASIQNPEFKIITRDLVIEDANGQNHTYEGLCIVFTMGDDLNIKVQKAGNGRLHPYLNNRFPIAMIMGTIAELLNSWNIAEVVRLVVRYFETYNPIHPESAQIGK